MEVHIQYSINLFRIFILLQTNWLSYSRGPLVAARELHDVLASFSQK